MEKQESATSVTKQEIPSNVSFKTYVEIGLRKITNVNNKNIYEITKHGICNRYITIPENIKYIGVVNISFLNGKTNKELYILNLIEDGNFSELDYDKLNQINEKQLMSLGKSTREGFAGMKILKDNISNFFLIPPLSATTSCQPLKDLQLAKEIIDMLNRALDEKCPGFRLNIDYILDLPNPSFVTLFSEIIEPRTLLLCLFNGNNCISSLTLKIERDVINIDSQTNKRYEGRKFNKLLRAVIIIIGIKLDARIVRSEAVNPISVYLMKNSFHAKTNDYVIDELETFDEIKAVMDSRELAEYEYEDPVDPDEDFVEPDAE